jgi:hypothetical protein
MCIVLVESRSLQKMFRYDDRLSKKAPLQSSIVASIDAKVSSLQPIGGNMIRRNYLPVTPAAPAPGGVDDVLWLSAKIVPSAAPAAATAPSLISRERVWCCLAGAIAMPAGFAAAPPDVGTLSAVAAPTGSVCVLGRGASGIVVVV